MIVAPIPIFVLLTAIQFVVVPIIAVLFGIVLAVGAIFVVVPVVVILVRPIINAPVTLLIVTMLVIPAILFLPVFILTRGSCYDRRRGAEPCPQKNHTDVLSCRFHRAISSWFKFDCGIWALSTSMSGACKSSIQGIGYTITHCACRTRTLADPDLRLTLPAQRVVATPSNQLTRQYFPPREQICPAVQDTPNHPYPKNFFIY